MDMTSSTSTANMMDVCVCNPVTDTYTTFDIIIHTSDPAFTLPASKTRRRYNDFCWLRKVLKTHHPLIECPELPPKLKSSARFEIQFVVQRMTDLEAWLRKVMEIRLYLSDTSLHLFLQTSLTCKQIELYTSGKLSERVVQKNYNNCRFTGPAVVRTDIGSQPDRTTRPPEPSQPIALRKDSNPKPRDDSGVVNFASSDEEDSVASDSEVSLPSSVDSGNHGNIGPYPPVTVCENKGDSVCNEDRNQSNIVESGLNVTSERHTTSNNTHFNECASSHSESDSQQHTDRSDDCCLTHSIN